MTWLQYANYGSKDDFDHLKNLGVETSGAIVLTRYGGTENDRALKVYQAAQNGAVGCIIYSDPAEDGFTRGPEYPNGLFMPSDGVSGCACECSLKIH